MCSGNEYSQPSPLPIDDRSTIELQHPSGIMQLVFLLQIYGSRILQMHST